MICYEHHLDLTLQRTKHVDQLTGKAAILLRIDIDTHSGAIVRTPVTATAAEWNAARQRLQVQYGMSPADEQHVLAINATLTRLLQTVERVYMVYRSQGGDPSPQEIADLVRGLPLTGIPSELINR